MSQNQRRQKIIQIIPVILLCLCLLLEQTLLVTASSSDNTPKPTSITELSSSPAFSFNPLTTYKLNLKKNKLVIGKSFTLRVLNLPESYTVSFKSRNKRIAVVDARGKVTGKKNGTVQIIATVKRKSLILRNLTCNVTVGPSACSIVIPESKITLSVNEKKDLKPIIKPKSSTEVPLFFSSNPSVVRVSSAGIITGVGKGNATITVSIANKKFDTCVVTVTMKKTKKAK